MENNAILTAVQWRKSSYSGDQGGQCIEIAETLDTTIAVRDSKNPTGPILTIAPAAFATFVSWTTTAG
ncbi:MULTISPECIES: DUF397 domain-containing protein [Streptomyces]|jgi:Domain of unknown function (DUF397).|uniref:DUF397 domain-containing protein n=1 Tax=Streptomyces TaxID=1883 RepID=UPI0009CF691B|nr:MULTISPECIES: DUF397 domain-containing protein [Streptomyces]KAF5997529.1 DUF397 domain-containing protein [Streptomyces sp. WAC00263]MCX4424545.1 DUF397 domain-containing protein [Streptomyces mirabilis]MCX4608407.1 DUF397 domain-containing protein [Streptomyces mirabilis]MCX5348871.1 DUF397 domain-containing protein [Streptomyces mirabilis]MCZ0998755.1 DUF397 domain-containing protein [Streptomyces mirabilis]